MTSTHLYLLPNGGVLSYKLEFIGGVFIMKNKVKGFTLVELLAVIVILAIILVIAVPKITDTIKNSKRHHILKVFFLLYF